MARGSDGLDEKETGMAVCTSSDGPPASRRPGSSPSHLFSPSPVSLNAR